MTPCAAAANGGVIVKTSKPTELDGAICTTHVEEVLKLCMLPSCIKEELFVLGLFRGRPTLQEWTNPFVRPL
jgi:hypothetical protein